MLLNFIEYQTLNKNNYAFSPFLPWQKKSILSFIKLPIKLPFETEAVLSLVNTP